MDVTAYDVQVCLWKILKLSWKTFVTISTKHPFASFSSLCLFLLYMLFPLVFWVLIYSFPVVICTFIILSISFNLGNGKKFREDHESEEDQSDGNSTFPSENRKPYSRVHSVRRRRAKDIRRDNNNNYNNEQYNKVEEKVAVSSTNFNYDMIDKKALIEESPKEIREVQVEYHSSQAKSTKKITSPSSDPQSSKQQFGNHHIIESSIMGSNDKEEEAMQENEDNDQKNVHLDVGISETERTKRLESLIARRRSRKLLSLQVRRTLMNMDRNDRPGQIASIVIPKNNNASFSPSNVFSPGSAPSVLVPMRNPFDLPYDPQEEKPDLTGDSFHQEFLSGNNNRDVMFCRHESFSLGGLNQNGEQGNDMVHEFGFRQSGSSSLGHPFSDSGNDFENEFAPIMEQESYEVSESKSNIDSPDEDDDDHIKEVIQVYENGINSNSEDDEEQEEDENTDEAETRAIPREDFSTSTSTSSPSSSEEDDAPNHFKIDKEAILKSLSSMARRNVSQEEAMENNEQIGDHLMNYNTSGFENKLKEQFYYGDKTMMRRHTHSYSIASDLQVEVSEVSSPPLTIDENFSYQGDDISSYDGEMEKKINWDDEELWTGSSRVLSQVDDNESRSTEVNEVGEQDMIKVGFSRINNNKHDDTTVSNSMEEPALMNGEQYCISSSSSNAEFQNSSFNLNEDRQKNRYNLVTIPSHGNDSAEIESNEERFNLEPIPHSEGEQSSTEASVTRTTTLDTIDHQPQLLLRNVAVEHVQSSLGSPKSVLLPTFSLDQGSLSSFDHEIDDEVRQFGAHNAEVLSPVELQNSTASMQKSADLPCFSRDVEVLQESSEPSTASTTVADDTQSVNKQNIHENGVNSKEVDIDSSQTPRSHEAPPETTDEISCRSFDNNHDVSSKSSEAATPYAFSADDTDNSNSSPSTKKEFCKHQEMTRSEYETILDDVHGDDNSETRQRAADSHGSMAVTENKEETNHKVDDEIK